MEAAARLPGARVEVRDLYALYPDYVIDVATEQQHLAAAELLVWLYPVHWYSMPPLLKLWLDEVFAFGWAYGPGGRALALDTTPPGPGPLRPLIRFHLRHVIPLLGRLVAGDAEAYNYLPETSERVLSVEALAARLRAAGFERVFERDDAPSESSERESELLRKIGELTVERDFLSRGLGRLR
jgi:hypothetical protein